MFNDVKELVLKAARDGIKPSVIKQALVISTLTNRDFVEVLLITEAVEKDVNAALATL